MGFLPIAAAVITTAATAFSAYTKHEANQFQGKVAERNAAITDQNRTAAVLEGQVEESAKKSETSRRVGAALAEQAANGVDVGFGSPADYRGALQNEGDLDAMTINYNTQRKALGFVTQQQGYLTQASSYKAAATNAALGGVLDTGASFLSSATSLQDRSFRLKTSGANLTGS